MKTRNKVFFAVLVILMLWTTITYAGESKYISVVVDKVARKVVEVPVVMNNEILNTKTPSFLYGDRTLVPARLISEYYGAAVGWTEASQKVTVEHLNNIIEFRIGSVDVSVNGKAEKLDKNSVPRLVNFGGDSAVTMVPLNFLGEFLGYKTDWDQENRVAYIQGSDNMGENERPEENKPIIKPKPEEKNYNIISGVEKVKVNGEDALKVVGNRKVEMKTFELSNPKRLVIDLLDSKLPGEDARLDYSYDLGVVKSVRVSQFTPDKNYKEDDKIVRVVLDMKDGEANPKVDISNEGGNLILKPAKSFWDNIDYSNNVLTINKKINSNNQINFDRRTKSLTIKMPANSTNLMAGTKTLSDDLAGEIQVVNDGSNVTVTLRTWSIILYDRIQEDGNKLSIKLTKDPNITNKDRIIVIDPGHGAHDPGTTSVTGKREKDMNLEIAKKLNQKLKAKGYNTIMTRDNDSFVELVDRAKIANDNFADVFVSIHGNSFGSKDIKGIETYYYTKATDREKYLATIVQKELINATKASSRGAKPGNLSVVRNTKMPAILVEVGFMSNPEEDRLLKTADYQNKIADAISKGIDGYFKKY